MAPSFDDSSWPAAPAKFGFNNNNNSGITTVVSYGTNASNKYPTYYFRKLFVVPTLAGLTNLYLEVMRDDGVAVYLNGRSALPRQPACRNAGLHSTRHQLQ